MLSRLPHPSNSIRALRLLPPPLTTSPLRTTTTTTTSRSFRSTSPSHDSSASTIPTSAPATAAAAAAAPPPPRGRSSSNKPVGAFRGGAFGFLLGAVCAGAGTFYYVMEEYRVSNELLTEDIYVRDDDDAVVDVDFEAELYERVAI